MATAHFALIGRALCEVQAGGALMLIVLKVTKYALEGSVRACQGWSGPPLEAQVRQREGKPPGRRNGVPSLKILPYRRVLACRRSRSCALSAESGGMNRRSREAVGVHDVAGVPRSTLLCLRLNRDMGDICSSTALVRISNEEASSQVTCGACQGHAEGTELGAPPNSQ